VRIREIDLNNPDFLASKNYMQVAIDHGWYDPKSGAPFIWQEVYAPSIKEGSLSRLWFIYSSIAPSFKEWPRRKLKGSSTPMTMYSQGIEGAAYYPFSVKPDKKLSVQDVIAFQRSTNEGTIYDMTADPAWLVPTRAGSYTKSPLTTPFPSFELIQLLGINFHRPIATQGYGMVAQLRDWLPDAIGGVYWFYIDNPYVSAYVPIYAGVQEVSEPYKTFDIKNFSEDSARWGVDFVEKLMHLNWQSAVKDLKKARDPLENGFFAEQKEVDEKALILYKKDPVSARNFLTKLTIKRMNLLVEMYRNLRFQLLSKYSNDLF
jgi:dipeptidase